jgi:ABC-type uncharacterized transport system permease subunit
MALGLIRVVAVCYALASVCCLPGLLGGRDRSRRFALSAAGAGFVLHLVWFAQVLGAAHRMLPVGMHEVQSTLALLIAGSFLGTVVVFRTASFGIFALPLAVLLALPAALGPERNGFTSPLVQNGWIAVHVTALMAADAALLFSLLASLLYFVQERRLKDKRGPGFLTWLPPLDTMDRIGHWALVGGFACMTLGLCVGSVIAQSRVGSAYFHDPKVVLSFVLWALYVAMLLIRQSTGLRGKRAVYLSSVVFLLMLTVWAANLLSSVHRYGQP